MGIIGLAKRASRVERRLLGALVPGYLLFILAAGLWPFNFAPENQVQVVPSGGVRFEGHGLLASGETGLPIPPSTFAGAGTIEILLKPDETTDWGTTHILTFTDTSGYDLFYLGQWSDSLVLRWLDLDWNRARNVQEAGFSRILAKGSQRLLSLVFEPGRVSAFVDGSPIGARAVSVASWGQTAAPLMGIVLGSAADGSGPWRGEILGLSVLLRPIDPDEVKARYRSWVDGDIDNLQNAKGQRLLYAFEGDKGRSLQNRAGRSWSLEWNRRLLPPRRDFFLPPWREFALEDLYALDLAVNFLGFIPLGAGLAILFAGGSSMKGRGFPFFLPGLIGATTSLCIEVGQGFLISRSSSLLDLCLNTLGAAAGALLAMRLLCADP